MADIDSIREANIEANKKLLLSLGINAFATKPAQTKKTLAKRASSDPTPTRRSTRKSARLLARFEDVEGSDGEEGNDDEEKEDEQEYEGLDEEEEEDGDKEGSTKRKRRTRNSVPSSSVPRPKRKRTSYDQPMRKVKKLSKKGRPNPKVFGHQPNTPVGKTFKMRIDASQAGIHAPPVSGIAGTAADGAYSIALSGGYEDDLDYGYLFTYTGAGGRDLKGTKDNPKNLRTAPQSKDQTFENTKSSETKNPIRVIRGFKGDSPFAPQEGYRYDGLYVVERAWMATGAAGYKVCKYAIVRLPDQPNIPIQEGREEEARAIFEACGKGPNPDEEDEVEGEEEDVEQEQKEDAVGEIVDVAKEDGKGEVEDVVPASGSSSSGSVDGVGSDDGTGEKETPATSPAEEVEDERKD